MTDESRRRRRGPPAEPTHDRLLGAARELFARDGYGATSLDAVVAACGLTKGSLYHHFRGKLDLFEAVFEREAERLCIQVAEVVAEHADSWEAALAGIEAYLRFSQEPGVQRIGLLDGPSVLGWERVREIEAQYGLALIKAAVGQLIEAGRIAPHDVDSLSHLLFGALSEGALLIARAADPELARATVERELRLLVEGLRVR